MSDNESTEKGPAYSNAAVTSDIDLKQWCSKNNIKFNMIDLIDLDNFKEDYGYVFTGSAKNAANEGNLHHWLAVVGDEVFDSYGLEDYKLPESFSFMKHTPKQLQHYSSNVCGEYCSLLLLEASKNQQDQGSNLAKKFITKYRLGNNQKHNDGIILEQFRKLAPAKIKERLENSDDNEKGGSMRTDRVPMPNGATDRRAPLEEPVEVDTGNPKKAPIKIEIERDGLGRDGPDFGERENFKHEIAFDEPGPGAYTSS